MRLSLIGICLGSLIVGYILANGLFFQFPEEKATYQDWKKTANWQKSTATLISAEPGDTYVPSGKTTAHRFYPRLNYQYKYKGASFVGNEISLYHKPKFVEALDCKSWIDKLRQRQPFEIMIDPEQPNNAIIERGNADVAFLRTARAVIMAMFMAVFLPGFFILDNLFSRLPINKNLHGLIYVALIMSTSVVFLFILESVDIPISKGIANLVDH